MLLPPSMQDKTEFMPLGKAVQKPEPVKADPIREFEKHNHDIPGAPKLPRVTPEMAARALRSLCVDGLKEAFVRISKQYDSSINREYSEPWEGLFQKQAAKQMERLDKLRRYASSGECVELRPGDTFTIEAFPGKRFEFGGQELKADGSLSEPKPLTWPTLPDLPEPTFLPEVVNEAPSRDTEPLGDLAAKIKEAEERARVGSMVLEVERRLATYGIARLNIHDMNAIREWFGPLDIPAAWLGKIAYSSEFQRMFV